MKRISFPSHVVINVKFRTFFYFKLNVYFYLTINNLKIIKLTRFTFSDSVLFLFSDATSEEIYIIEKQGKKQQKTIEYLKTQFRSKRLQRYVKNV